MSMKQTGGSQPSTKFLEGFKFYLCGVDEREEQKAKKAISLLGGTCSETFTESVNCGLVRKVGASGYASLQKSKTRMIVMQWLYDCYAQKTILSFQSYSVKPLQGLVVVCTQVSPEERFKVQRLVHENGGRFSTNLEKNKCTHLVAKTPEGDKYTYARSWGNVRIVTLDWIDECIKRKEWIPEMKYIIHSSKRKYTGTSKPAAESLSSSVPKGNKSDTTQQSLLVAATASCEKRRSGPGIVEQLDAFVTNAISFGLISNTSFSSTAPDLHSVYVLKLLDNSNGWFNHGVFAGQIFWIHGYDDDQRVRDYLIQCVIAGGGFRSMVLCDAVTKVAMGRGTTASDWTLIKRHPCGVECVNVIWVMEQLFTLPVLLEFLWHRVQIQHHDVDQNASTSTSNSTHTLFLYLNWLKGDQNSNGRSSLHSSGWRYKEVDTMEQLVQAYDEFLTFMDDKEMQAATETVKAAATAAAHKAAVHKYPIASHESTCISAVSHQTANFLSCGNDSSSAGGGGTNFCIGIQSGQRLQGEIQINSRPEPGENISRNNPAPPKKQLDPFVFEIPPMPSKLKPGSHYGNGKDLESSSATYTGTDRTGSSKRRVLSMNRIPGRSHLSSQQQQQQQQQQLPAALLARSLPPAPPLPSGSRLGQHTGNGNHISSSSSNSVRNIGTLRNRTTTSRKSAGLDDDSQQVRYDDNDNTNDTTSDSKCSNKSSNGSTFMR